MSARIEECDLIGLGLTEQEKQIVLASNSRERQIHLLRLSRGRLLEDLHDRQQTLDRLDYFIYQIKNTGGNDHE